MQHSIFGIKINSRTACIIAGTSFILFAVFLLFIGGIEILIGVTETMPVKGSGVNEQLNIHNALSPVFYVEGILILSGGLLLFNNGLKFILNKSPFRFFLRRAILSSILLFFAILLMQASLLYIWRQGSGGPDFKMLLFPVVFFAVSFLLYFVWKKIFKRKAAKDYWALLPVFIIIVSLLALTGILANTHYHSDADEAAANNDEGKKISWFKLLSYKQTWAYVIGKFLTDPIWWFYLFWLPDFFESVYKIKTKK